MPIYIELVCCSGTSMVRAAWGFGCRPGRERSACIGWATGRASNAGGRPKDFGPQGCAENGPAAALLLSCDAQRHRSLLAPWRRAQVLTEEHFDTPKIARVLELD